jgi:ligand-binding sensor domain-containing protein
MDPANADADFEEDYTFWHYPYVLVAPDGKIFTVNQSGASPGTRTVARWTDGKAVRIGREVSENYSCDSFITGDGALWNSSSAGLLRFENGKWEVATADLKFTGRLKPILSKGPPWILMAPRGEALWRLDDQGDGKKTTLIKLKLQEGADELKIFDVIPWTDDLLLLATNSGLRGYDSKNGTLAKVDRPEPPKPAAKLTRDGLGRLWLGGENGLWMSEKGAKEVESFDPVPSMKGARVDAIAADPARSDGVIVVLEERGVVFLSAKAKP